MRRAAHRLLACGFAVAALLAAGGVQAQENAASAACARSDIPVEARALCVRGAQAFVAAGPQLGVAASGGGQGVGVSGGGFRLGLIPGVALAVQLTAAPVRLPSLGEPPRGSGADPDQGTALALSATAAVPMFAGFRPAPALSGVGALDLLGTAGWTDVAGDPVAGSEGGPLIGGGVRVGLLRESFVTPGVAVLAVYRRLPNAQSPAICTGGSSVGAPGDYQTERCVGTAAAAAEIDANMAVWSSRLVVGKGISGVALSGGVGYDHSRTAGEFAFQLPTTDPGEPEVRVGRVRSVEVDQGRWMAFVGATRTLAVAAGTLEVGWLQGGRALSGYPPEPGGFDPGAASWFGSLGVRVAL